MNSLILLHQLADETRTIIQAVEQEFFHLSEAQLIQSNAPGQWSVVECLEHLNTYGRYYLPLFEQHIERAEKQSLAPTPVFRSGWLGNYFVNMMRPKTDGSIGNKAKAAKIHVPSPNLSAKRVLTEFLAQQRQLLSLLRRAEHVSLSQPKIPISIARFITIKLGDALRFLVAHEQRHLLQAQKAVGQTLVKA